MKVKELIIKYLKITELDGLFLPERNCCCELKNLFPCQEDMGAYELTECQLGKKQKWDEESEICQNCVEFYKSCSKGNWCIRPIKKESE